MNTDILKTALADHIESSLIVQGYHWNIEGDKFTEYHELFGDIYSQYHDQIDTLAEYIRIVSVGSEYVSVTVEVVRLNKTVDADVIVGNKPTQMCEAIIVLNDKLRKSFINIFELASNENIQGLANYCAERMNYLDKLDWQLIAISKNK